MSKSPKENKTIPSLSNAEWQVIKPLWDRGPLAARDVYAALPEGHGWAYRTVKTMLSRLVAKGALDYQQVGNSYLYRAVCSRDQVTQTEVKNFIDRIADGALGPVLAHFVQGRDLAKDEIARLRELLDQKEREATDKLRRKKL